MSWISMHDLHLPTQPSPPILLKRYRRNAVMALEPGQGRKTAALRDAHQVPLLTGGALSSRGQNRSGSFKKLKRRVLHTVSSLEPALGQMLGLGRERRNLPEGQTNPLG